MEYVDPEIGFEEPEPIELPPAPDRPSTYVLHVEIEDADPLIWRRIVVRSDIRLDKLHRVLQAAFGWEDSHLHRFALGDPYSDPAFLTAFDREEGDEGTSEEDARLDQVLRSPGDTLTYEYDFGDGWTHQIALEAVTEASGGAVVARCVDGERAGPVEDSGGVHGYNAIAAWHRAGRPADDDTVDAELMAKWLPRDFDPDAFSAEKADTAVHAAARRRR